MSSRLFERVLHSPAELDDFVAELESHFGPRTIVLLEGEVGSGKTETVRALARRRGWREVASPSFAIRHRYENENGEGADHLDLYRLENEEDLESTGFWDLFADEAGLVLIEWAERINSSYLPLSWVRLRVTYRKGQQLQHRTIAVDRL